MVLFPQLTHPVRENRGMARRGRPTAELILSEEERETLARWARRPKSSQQLALRARIVLACADGATNTEVAAQLQVARPTVGKWRARFVADRLDGLVDEPRPGAPRTITDEQVERVVADTLESTPRDATHWSRASMAAHSGLSRSTVGRIWRAFRLQPHRAETFKLSRDPLFIDKVRDVVGLYLDPPERAIVLSVDEKSQVQALDRSAPVLPMMPGVPERATHDYLRHGVTSLFAALDIATGQVISSLHRRHRSTEFRKFLDKIDKQVPADLDVHLIADNYATHKTDIIQNWLARHPRFHMHFVPTSSSWLNQVERWFAELTTKLLQRGVHTSVQALEADIRNWIKNWNENPRPFVWTKTADEILEALSRYCQRISGAGH
jgi:transposase